MSFRGGHPQRKVRIVKRRIPSRAAGLSLAAVAVTAVFSFAAWRWWRADQAPINVPSLLEDVELDWKCDQGHVFQSQGQVGGRPCPVCREMAYPVTTYACSTHGAVEVKVQFGRDDSGRTNPILFRIQNGPWSSGNGGPKCPKCDEIMTRKDIDPLEGLVKPKRKGSGS